MALTARLTLTGPDAIDPEDIFGSSLGVIFTDDVTNQHGDTDHGLLYTSPHLPRPLPITLADVRSEHDRFLYSHYLWNSALLLAELIEAGTLRLGPRRDGVAGDADADADAGTGTGIPWDAAVAPAGGPAGCFDVSGLATMELGAGTALPSVMAGLLGAARVVVTDYPAPAVLATLRHNVEALVRAELAPAGRFRAAAGDVLVAGHEWGRLDDAELARAHRHAFDRVIAADCLWMPGQHENLRRSVAWFLKDDAAARAWVVAGFHTGRQKMAAFFDKEALAGVGLEVEYLWERDCDGKDRAWVWDRGVEDVSVRKRWLAIGVLRRIPKLGGSSEGAA